MKTQTKPTPQSATHTIPPSEQRVIYVPYMPKVLLQSTVAIGTGALSFYFLNKGIRGLSNSKKIDNISSKVYNIALIALGTLLASTSVTTLSSTFSK